MNNPGQPLELVMVKEQRLRGVPPAPWLGVLWNDGQMLVEILVSDVDREVVTTRESLVNRNTAPVLEKLGGLDAFLQSHQRLCDDLLAAGAGAHGSLTLAMAVTLANQRSLRPELALQKAVAICRERVARQAVLDSAIQRHRS